jgi:hypothetical protein
MEFSMYHKNPTTDVEVWCGSFTDFHFIPIFKLALKNAVGNFAYYIMEYTLSNLKIC